MNYADVAIDADWIPPGKTFSYRIPRHLAVEPGQLVWVQFGRNIVQGLVLSLADASAVSEEETRDILHPVEPSPAGWFAGAGVGGMAGANLPMLSFRGRCADAAAGLSRATEISI